MKCVHHFVLETPDGPHARGACKRCGEVRQFTNGFCGDIRKELWRGEKTLQERLRRRAERVIG